MGRVVGKAFSVPTTLVMPNINFLPKVDATIGVRF
jgi:hypothetical protein